jgi:SRSO17 transposase
VLVLDDTGCPKQGTAPAGVARQYSGTRGKVGNCQVAVPCCATDPQASGPVAVRWYLPQAWADAPNRRHKARVPPEGTWQTKAASALALRDRVRAWGGPIVAWWLMPLMATIAPSWQAWRNGTRAM